MSLYGHNMLKESAKNEIEGVDMQPYVELFAYDDISRDSSENIHEFVQSETATVLCEKQVLNKKSLMRLSKADDEKRRIKLVVYQMAKENNDPDWKKMVMYRTKMKEHRAKLIKKYGNRAQKIARSAQREYIKRAKKDPTVSASAKEK